MMSPKDPDKNKDVIKELEKDVSPILIVNNSSLKPYVELFEYAPENIYQQPLGLLAGFFEIKEYSENSAYIVNFLTSVLKKEYYINPKRSVGESLDSALHKVNVALSELAKHGNVEWLGKLNAAICVFEKNSAHFSVSGSAKVFLYRGGILSDVSEDMASDSVEPHPLKTFVNVSSGRLERDDRMLITSEDIFHILSLQQLRKNFERLEGQKFVQFLKTALSNQLEMIATLAIEIKEKEVVDVKIPSSKKKIEKTANFFSEKTYAKAAPSPLIGTQKSEETEDSVQESEYTDKKTGHIYVQGESGEVLENSKTYMYWDIGKEKFSMAWYVAKNCCRRNISLWKKNFAKKRELAKIEKEKRKQAAEEERLRLEQEKKLAEAERQKQMEDQKREQEKILAQQKILEEQKALEKQKMLEQQRILEEENSEEEPANEQIQEIKTQSQLPKLSFREKLNRAIIENQKNSSADEQKAPDTSESDLAENDMQQDAFLNADKFFSRYREKQRTVLQEISQKTADLPDPSEEGRELSESEKTGSRIDFFLRFKPDFSKIKSLFASFSNQQKISALAAIILIIVVPFFIVRWTNRPKPQISEAVPAAMPAPGAILANEKNIDLAPQEKILLSGKNIVNVLATGSNVTAITKNNAIVISQDQQKEYELPAEAANPVKATYMKDLSLVFIFTDKNKVVSFSPVSYKFTTNDIELENASSILSGTYMTYLYVLDGSKNQIYRYPRATGGFGTKTSWLKDEIPLSGINDIAIDENIYCAENDKVSKLFKGKAEEFSLEKSLTPVQFDKIFTSIDSGFLYVLDLRNSRLVQYNKADGTIAKQYFSEKIRDASSFSVDEQARTAYVATPNELAAISL